eukprot:Gb_17573 [translate_table: standard]
MVGMDNQEQIPHHKAHSQTEILQIKPVGIDSQATKVIELLDMENSGGAARAVIIYGFGGIDNVTDKSHVTDLLLEQLSLPRESRMLITSRDSDVKVGLDIKWQEYPMNVLPDEIAKQFLRNTVLKTGHVICVDDELERIDKIAEACGGVPLLLKVYGEHLWEDGSDSSFDEALASLREGEQGVYKERALSQKLLFVFHRMKDQDAKDAFLDICTYFHEWSRDVVSCIVGESKLKALQRGALLTINENSKVIVHDVLRAMGISQAKGTRLRGLEELKATLEEAERNHEKLKTIKGIWIDEIRFDLTYEKKSDFLIECKMLDSMSNSLRVLALINGIRVDGRWIAQARQVDLPKMHNIG